jgi:hypothetical protein
VAAGLSNIYFLLSGYDQTMSSEEALRPGMRVEYALQQFRAQVNRPDTMFSTDRWLLPKLEKLQTLLADPITADPAQALDDVLHGRHWMADLFEWLESPPTPWVDFFAYREEMKPIKEQVGREQAGEQWKAFQELSRELGGVSEKPKVCPSCGSHSVIPIAYGAPNGSTAEAVRRGAVTLGGCILRMSPKWCCRECNYRWPKEVDDEA